jgi:hypothetical protein
VKGGRAFISFARLYPSSFEDKLPEVSDLDCLMITKEVLGFEVSMEVVVLVHISEALECLEHYVSYLML